ncbi:MAG: phosphatidate cytidylyltransferase [Parachlamydiales bacterium]|jgi:phosphatidate cytidylyltransferase
MKDLARRLLASLFGVSLLFILLYFAKQPFFQGALALLIALLCAFALQEFSQLAKAKGLKLKTAFLIPSGVLFSLSFFLCPDFSFFLFWAFFLFSFLLEFKKTEGAFLSVGSSVFGFLYVALPLGLVFPILYSSHFDGRMWLFYLLAVTKSTDVGGYFGGMFFGKKKLAEHLSPKKTIAGAIAGTLAAVFVSYLFYSFGQSVAGGRESGFVLSLGAALALGLALAVFGQAGDLAESLLKRDAKTKDSGCLPGFGGVLDLLDSLLFTLPVLFFYLEAVK